MTVQLEDTRGDVLATTTTNSRGRYTFNQLSGPAANPENTYGVSGTGFYRVVLVPPASMHQVSTNPRSIRISRGEINASGINFVVTNVVKQATTRFQLAPSHLWVQPSKTL